jgi:hypothetical protein
MPMELNPIIPRSISKNRVIPIKREIKKLLIEYRFFIKLISPNIISNIMPYSKVKTQETSQTFSAIIISSNPSETELGTPAPIKICWNTGEEKNCPACYLSKGCKAKTL